MVEAIVGVVLASVLLTAFISLNVQATKLNCANVNNFKADMYLKELIEVAKDLEQSDWNELTNNPICYSASGCHPEILVGKWTLVGNDKDLFKGYSYRIILTNVMRDQCAFPNEIDEISGTYLDPNTKKITAQILFDDVVIPNLELEIYVYNYNNPVVCP